jgi:hypothetical protein
MPSSILTLAGIAFDSFSTPKRMGAGGNQALVVHKLPGGERVIDTLGADEADIGWTGEFFGDDAYASVLALDAIRQAGQVVPLIFAGQYRSVIVSSFNYSLRREPVWCEYQIVCTVYQNPSAGILGATTSSVESLVLSDLAVAIGL